jgi:hypothetical protein
MNNRKLSRKDALAELIICRQRLVEALHLFTLWDDLRNKKITPTLTATETTEDYLETLRTAFLGWLASLIDKAKDAIDVFDVWRALFPAEQGEIVRFGRRTRLPSNSSATSEIQLDFTAISRWAST